MMEFPDPDGLQEHVWRAAMGPSPGLDASRVKDGSPRTLPYLVSLHNEPLSIYLCPPLCLFLAPQSRRKHTTTIRKNVLVNDSVLHCCGMT